jgi:ankyrin repeat protein
LIYAAEIGHVEVCQILLDNGADASIKDSNGETALDCARKNSHQDVIEILSKLENS